MEVKVQERRVQGWMSAAALYGVFGCLIPYVAATPLGWLGALLGAFPALFIRPKLLPGWLQTVRGLWGVGAAALSLGECARGIVNYTYPGWSWWMPALLLLIVAWRGSRLDEKGLERCGKLLVWIMLAITAVLVLLALPRLDIRMERPDGIKDFWETVWIGVLSFGCVSFVTPFAGCLPGVLTVVSGAAAGGLTAAALGPALSGILRYPFLVLCDAAAFELRLSSLGTAMWALSECSLLILLLNRLPGGKWGRGIGAIAVFGLCYILPWSSFWVLIYLAIGAVLGCIPYLVMKNK